MTEKKRKSVKTEADDGAGATVPTFDTEAGSVEAGARLELARDLLGLKQAQWAAALGVGLSTYHRYRRGEAAPGMPELARAAALGIDMNWLVTGIGSPRRNAPPAPADEASTGAPLLEDLLENVIRSVELYLAAQGLGMAPDRKARLVVVLYRVQARRRARRAAEGLPFPEGEAGAVIPLDSDPDLLDTVRLAL